MQLPKIRNYKNIVKLLKKGPDFGIHGAKYKNLDAIFKENWVIPGHYFAVDSEAKSFPDKEFYERLCASVQVAFAFSNPEGAMKNEYYTFKNPPCILLGIDHKNKRLIHPEPGNKEEYLGGLLEIAWEKLVQAFI